MKTKLPALTRIIQRGVTALQSVWKTGSISMIAVLTLLPFAHPCVHAAPRVSTLAGSLTRGSADGIGSAAQFFYPAGLAVDGIGNVYVADNANSIIRKITPDGEVTTLAGTPGVDGQADGVGGAAEFYNPNGVAVDSTGNLYVTGNFNYTIRMVTGAGVVTTLAGTPGVSGTADGTGSAAQFSRLHGIGVDSSDNVYVADFDNHAIRKMEPGGVVTTFAGKIGVSGTKNGTGGAARFNHPVGIAVDGSNNVYVSETDNQTIRKITPGGVVTTLAGTPGVAGSTDGTGTSARFNYPSQIAVDSGGTVYVADYGNHTIRKVTPAGVVTTIAGSAGIIGSTNGISTVARFDRPTGIAVDGAGNVYVDDENAMIRKLTRAAAFVEKEDVADGLVNAKFVSFGIPTINGDGNTAFYATVTGFNAAATTALAGKTKGIWAEDSAGERQLIIRTGDTAADTSSAVFSAMGDPVYNANEEIAFKGTLKTGVGDAVSTNNMGIWSNTGGTLHLVARKGAQAPGCPAGATFLLFSSFALPDQGGVVMLATLNAGSGGVLSTNNMGIWAVDTSGDLQLIVREGDMLDGKVITGLSFLPATTGVSGQTRSFSQSTGDLLYKATFSGGSTGIYKVVFP